MADRQAGIEGGHAGRYRWRTGRQVKKADMQPGIDGGQAEVLRRAGAGR
jgi:hypothetical protein